MVGMNPNPKAPVTDHVIVVLCTEVYKKREREQFS
jgi:hypothetical protein